MTHHLSPNKFLSKTDLFSPILKGLSSNIVSVGIKQNMVLIPAPFQNHLGKKRKEKNNVSFALHTKSNISL